MSTRNKYHGKTYLLNTLTGEIWVNKGDAWMRFPKISFPFEEESNDANKLSSIGRYQICVPDKDETLFLLDTATANIWIKPYNNNNEWLFCTGPPLLSDGSLIEKSPKIGQYQIYINRNKNIYLLDTEKGCLWKMDPDRFSFFSSYSPREWQRLPSCIFYSE